MCRPIIHGPDPIHLDGRNGHRYWVHHPFEFTGDKETDTALSSFPVAVFLPEGRKPDDTPVLVALQGMAAPFQWNGFIVPTLLDMGIACVMFDAPFAGERSLIRDHPGDAVRQVIPLVRKNISINANTVFQMMSVMARDIQTVFHLAADRHGLTGGRKALMGVSMGCLFASFAFTCDGSGERLLGVIGHSDSQMFARSFAPMIPASLIKYPAMALAKLLAPFVGPFPEAGVMFLDLLTEMRGDGDMVRKSNPMTYADRVRANRKVRYLVGEKDHLVSIRDTEQVCSRFKDAKSYAVPGLGHGTSSGPSFVDHVRTFVGTQLADWR
jgi:hypothetical protein